MTAIIVYIGALAMLLFAMVMWFVTREAIYPVGAFILVGGMAASITHLYTQYKEEMAYQKHADNKASANSSSLVASPDHEQIAQLLIEQNTLLRELQQEVRSLRTR